MRHRIYELRRSGGIRAKKRARRMHRGHIRRERVARYARLRPQFGMPGLGRRRRGFRPREIKAINIPRIFSILDDPESALRVLEEIRVAAANQHIRHIRLDHSGCDVLGLCASTVMDVTLLEAASHRRPNNSLTFSGRLPNNRRVELMLRASGILRHLNLSESVLSSDAEKLVRRCELFHGKPKRIEHGIQRDIAATKMTDYFDECLNTLGYELSIRGKSYLSALLTEVIGNAEEHGGRWWTIGHWQLGEDSEKRFGECHIVILNFGNTIYESLAHHNKSAQLTAQLRRLSDLHRGRGFFGFRLLGKGWDEETLWTLYALQERVSRFSDTPRGRDRGNGTVNIIEFFNHLAGGADHKMCVSSGKAYILFDGKYQLKPVQRGGETLKVIAFNAENDLESPPDREYVHSLNNHFPGTVVSIRLTLDETYLAEVYSDDEHNDEQNDERHDSA